MPRYLVERSFHDGLALSEAAEPAGRDRMIAINSAAGVTWLRSYVSADRRSSFCICDGPTPEAIRHAARRNGLPVTHITEISDLSPYGLG
jgi:hypothetical protein